MAINHLVQWFTSKGGTVDTSCIGITEFPSLGRGAVALKDIPEGHTLFTIPRDMTLSTRTSLLPVRLGKETWKLSGLAKGWAGLILCMMWEEAQGSASKWSTYLSSLPSAFDTPMFWTDEEIAELSGTTVVDKIGKDDAEGDYSNKVTPVMKSRPDLFPEEAIQTHYSMERYHVMGSRILSRSFHVEMWNGEDEDAEDDGGGAETDVMDVDISGQVQGAQNAHNHNADDSVQPGKSLEMDFDDEEDEDEDVENPADVAMVPMADMLNARYGSENAKLFYEARDLRMVTTKSIKTGEQIWNTYGDPPNSDLLRRYGHIDLVPLPLPLGGLGNPADIVEIPADLVVSVVTRDGVTSAEERVDWWLENAEDDTFVIGADCEVPEELYSLVRLLLLSKVEWEKTSRKGKLPKPKVDPATLDIVERVLQRRMEVYLTTLEEDEALLKHADEVSLNKRHAIYVRVGEKKLLRGTIHQVRVERERMKSTTKEKKRGREAAESEQRGEGKKSKR